MNPTQPLYIPSDIVEPLDLQTTVPPATSSPTDTVIAVLETQTVSPSPLLIRYPKAEQIVRVKIDELRLRLAEMQDGIGPVEGFMRVNEEEEEEEKE